MLKPGKYLSGKKSKAQRLFEIYGEELRKKINNDIKLAKDIEEFKTIS